MAGVEEVPLPQRGGWVAVVSVEDAVGDVYQPCPEGEEQRRVPGEIDVHGAGEEP